MVKIMRIYARLNDKGVLIEKVELPDDLDINSMFPQDQFTWVDVTDKDPMPDHWWTTLDNVNFNTPALIIEDPKQTIKRRFDAAINRGIVISSTSTPSINGIYSINDASLVKISREQQYIDRNGFFTNKQSVRSWMDSQNNPHMFPSVALFTLFVEAVDVYVDALQTALADANENGVWVDQNQPDPLD
jgi:hypothetical protein